MNYNYDFLKTPLDFKILTQIKHTLPESLIQPEQERGCRFFDYYVVVQAETGKASLLKHNRATLNSFCRYIILLG